MDDHRFDQLARRIGALTAPILPRRGLLRLAGGGSLVTSLGLLGGLDAALARKQDQDAEDEKKRRKNKNKNRRNRNKRNKHRNKNKNKNKKCKKEGKKCDKKKCKKKDKKCCCKGLKCKNDRCKGKGPDCPTKVSSNTSWTSFNSSGSDTFNTPWGIATDDDGNVYVTDRDNERVLIFDAGGSLDEEFGEEGNSDDEFEEPSGIAFNEASNRVFVLDPGQTTSRNFRRFSISGNHEENLGGDLTEPNGITVDLDDRIWVVDTSEERVYRYNSDGENPDIFAPSGSGALDSPQGIAVFEDDDDNTTYVYIADTGSNRVLKFEFVNTGSNGLAFREAAGSGGSDSDEFNQPTGLAVDECGNVWVADRLNNRIQILDKNLNFISRFTAGFNRPTGVAFSPNGNRLYVADSENDRIAVFDLS